MKILLVVPRFVRHVGEFYHFPLGLAYIASVLKQAGHEVYGLDCNQHAEPTESLLARTVLDIDPDICATGSLSPFLPEIRRILKAARRAKPGIVNVVGGGALSSDPEAGPLIMDADIGVIGEGELTVVDLCDALQNGRSLASVEGIVFRNVDGAITRTGTRPAIPDLGTIPWPDFELFGYGRSLDYQRTADHHLFHTLDRPRSIVMISGRSCPYRCTFCFHPSGKVYRERPLDDFFAELDHWIGLYGVNAVAIVDELFSLRKARIQEFCERIQPYGVQWAVQLHVNCADDAILERMKDAGCSYISFGIESMSQDVLVSMQKKSKTGRINKVLTDTYNHKIAIQGNLIFGDSAETLKSANESMHWWASHRQFMIYVNMLGVYPGSPDYIEAVRDGLIRDRIDFIERLNPDINISRINDADLDVMRTKLAVCRRSLLNIAPDASIEEEEEADPLRGQVHRIRWTCPRCDHRNDYRGAVLLPEHEYSLRLACRSCFTRFDIQNPHTETCANHPMRSEMDHRFHNAMAVGDCGTPGALHDIVSAAVWHYPSQIKLASHYTRAGDFLSAIRHGSAAVLFNPFEPACHIAYGDLMVSEGAIGFARMHYEQALQLDPTSTEAAAKFDALECGPWTEEQRATYFVSHSDAPPPMRLASEPPTCGGRRDEEEFPNIELLEVRTRERIGAGS